MKITRNIKVETDCGMVVSKNPEEVSIVSNLGNDTWIMSRGQAVQLRDALNVALDDERVTDEPIKPRVFIDPNGNIPADVTAVIDRGNDTWKRDGDGWLYGDAYMLITRNLICEWGPLTEVL